MTGYRRKGMAGTFDPVAARQAVEEFATVLATHIDVECHEKLAEAWKAAYLKCGHKALGRLMVGKSVDDACKSFER
jgi:hypothetical protein